MEGSGRQNYFACGRIHQSTREILHRSITLVNEKNWNGSTALDVVTGLPENDDRTEALRILRSFEAKTGPTISHPNFTQYLCSGMSWEKMVRRGTYLHIGIGNEMRNALLVVAVLIVAATYQGVLNPPKGNNNGINAKNTNTTTTTATVNLNDTTTDKLLIYKFNLFMSLNSFTLVISLGFISLLLPFARDNSLLHASVFSLMMSYLVAMELVWPPNTPGLLFLSCFSCIYFGAFTIFKVMIYAVRVYAVGKVFEGRNKFYSGYELVWIFFEKKYSSAKK